MALTTDERLREAFSLALEDRSKKLADLVSSSNVLTAVMKKHGGWKPFSGPAIRESLIFAETGSYVRYQGYDFLNPLPAEIVNDAVFEPKMAAVSVTLSGEDILLNGGKNQIKDIMTVRINAAERELRDNFYIDLHSSGTEANQITGMNAALSATPAAGTYGGIDRSLHAIWNTKFSDASDLTSDSAAFSSTNIHDGLTAAVIQVCRGMDGPNLILMGADAYRLYLSSLVAIQRVTEEKDDATLGFPAVSFAGAGKKLPVVLEGGVGTEMDANDVYILKVGEDGYKFRYHPQRNFVKFGGKREPTNQDAIVQHLGFMGNLTLQNPLWQFRINGDG